MNEFERALAYQEQPPVLHGLLGSAHGVPTYADFNDITPHLLLTGITGIGKTVVINNILLSIMRQQTSDKVQFMLIDGKGDSFGVYNKASNYMLERPVDGSSDLDMARTRIDEVLANMRYRLSLLRTLPKEEIGKVTDLPEVLLVIDEFSALLEQDASLKPKLIELLTLSRGSGIHLLLSNQTARRYRMITSNASNYATMGVGLKSESDILTNSQRGVALEKLRTAGTIYFHNAFYQAPYLTDTEVSDMLDEIAQK